MRFLRSLATATLGLLASQAGVVLGATSTNILSYRLDGQLTCSQLSDVIRVYYTFNGLATPPVPRNGVPPDSYEVAYRVVQSGNSAIPVGFPFTTVMARDGTGLSSMNYIPVTQNVTVVPKDNAATETTGLNLVYTLPGTTLFHFQVPGVSAVQGYFEIDNNAADFNGVTCDAMTSKPNIALVPQQYTINGIKQFVNNAFDVINNQAYLNYIASNPSASPVYLFDVQPAVNIDGCFNDKDPVTGAPRIRVPFRVTNLAALGSNEQGVLSLAVADGQGNPNSAWSVSITDKIGFIGQGFRDSLEPSIVNWVQPTQYSYVFGRLDFPAQGSNITCPDTNNPATGAVAGVTDLLISIVDYSTIDVTTTAQTWHFLAGAADNGINTAAQVSTSVGQLNVQAAATQPTQAPTATAAAKAARKAAAAKACAAKKAAAAQAAAAAAAAAAALAGQDAQHPCILVVPANPLTAAGLSTPYVLNSPCTMADTASFVQATILSPSTGKVFAYQPLVIGQGNKAAIKPVVPTLPADAVVGLWFGSNAVFQKLQGANNNANILTQANCVNGVVINGVLSMFGQTAACNGANLYAQLALAVFNGLITVPPLGNAADNKPCPTLRSFMMVDQDPQDNLQTQYLLDFNGNTAINTPANLNALTNAAKAAKQTPPIVLVNPGDNPLLSRFINPAIGCANWMIPDLSTNGQSVTAPIGELLAAFKQAAPIARMPAGNPMVLDDAGNLNINKLNAYRVGLAGQNKVAALADADTATFCKNMVGAAGAQRLLGTTITTLLKNAVGPTAGQSLFQFLTDRFAAAVGPMNLQCGKLVPGLTNPLAGGAVIAAQSAFAVEAALLVGAQAADNQAQDPYAELTGQTMSNNAGTGNTFPVAIVAGAIGGVVVLIIASLVIFKVVQKRKAGNVINATTARECKV
jgi:hypothetical protein